MHVSPVHPHARRLPPPPQNEETSQEGTLFEAGTSRRFGRCQGDGGELPAAQAEHQTPLCRGRGGHRGVLAPQPEPGEEACGMGCHQPPVRPGQGPAAVLLSFLTKCFREFLNLPKLNSERGDWSFQQPCGGRAGSFRCCKPTAGSTVYTVTPDPNQACDLRQADASPPPPDCTPGVARAWQAGIPPGEHRGRGGRHPPHHTRARSGGHAPEATPRRPRPQVSSAAPGASGAQWGLRCFSPHESFTKGDLPRI